MARLLLPLVAGMQRVRTPSRVSPHGLSSPRRSLRAPLRRKGRRRRQRRRRSERRRQRQRRGKRDGRHRGKRRLGRWLVPGQPRTGARHRVDRRPLRLGKRCHAPWRGRGPAADPVAPRTPRASCTGGAIACPSFVPPPCIAPACPPPMDIHPGGACAAALPHVHVGDRRARLHGQRHGLRHLHPSTRWPRGAARSACRGVPRRLRLRRRLLRLRRCAPAPARPARRAWRPAPEPAGARASSRVSPMAPTTLASTRAWPDRAARRAPRAARRRASATRAPPGPGTSSARAAATAASDGFCLLPQRDEAPRRARMALREARAAHRSRYSAPRTRCAAQRRANSAPRFAHVARRSKHAARRSPDTA